MIADRFNRVQPSATVAVSTMAKEMTARGADVIDLSVGEPDFPTPAHIKEAGIRAIREDQTRYTMNPGTIALREAIRNKFQSEYAAAYGMDQILVSNGAKQSVFNVCAAMLDPGDRALVLSPYWVSYPEMVRLLDAEPVVVETDASKGFVPDLDRIKAAMSGVKIVILNSPGNPTGAVFDEATITAVVDMAASAGAIVLSDEIYEKLVFTDASFFSTASLPESLRAHVVIVNGVSKAYAMTGWRVGYALGPKDVIKAASVLQSHSTSNACSISQAASVAALTGPDAPVRDMVVAFQRRRDAALARVNDIPGWTCKRPGGAFYLFVDVTESLGGPVSSSAELATHLIRECQVATVPGEAFGAPGFIRLSYATSDERLDEALTRIAGATARIAASR